MDVDDAEAHGVVQHHNVVQHHDVVQHQDLVQHHTVVQHHDVVQNHDVVHHHDVVQHHSVVQHEHDGADDLSVAPTYSTIQVPQAVDLMFDQDLSNLSNIQGSLAHIEPNSQDGDSDSGEDAMDVTEEEIRDRGKILQRVKIIQEIPHQFCTSCRHYKARQEMFTFDDIKRKYLSTCRDCRTRRHYAHRKKNRGIGQALTYGTVSLRAEQLPEDPAKAVANRPAVPPIQQEIARPHFVASAYATVPLATLTTPLTNTTAPPGSVSGNAITLTPHTPIPQPTVVPTVAQATAAVTAAPTATAGSKPREATSTEPASFESLLTLATLSTLRDSHVENVQATHDALVELDGGVASFPPVSGRKKWKFPNISVKLRGPIRIEHDVFAVLKPMKRFYDSTVIWPSLRLLASPDRTHFFTDKHKKNKIDISLSDMGKNFVIQVVAGHQLRFPCNTVHMVIWQSEPFSLQTKKSQMSKENPNGTGALSGMTTPLSKVETSHKYARLPNGKFSMGRHAGGVESNSRQSGKDDVTAAVTTSDDLQLTHVDFSSITDTTSQPLPSSSTTTSVLTAVPLLHTTLVPLMSSSLATDVNNETSHGEDVSLLHQPIDVALAESGWVEAATALFQELQDQTDEASRQVLSKAQDVVAEATECERGEAAVDDATREALYSSLAGYINQRKAESDKVAKDRQLARSQSESWRARVQSLRQQFEMAQDELKAWETKYAEAIAAQNANEQRVESCERLRTILSFLEKKD
eukprot:Colp12_sorted_trinity150504_noHs@24470